MSNTVKELNKQLADWNLLFVKLHNYHWFVKGENFFILHEKFEEYYDEAAKYIDEIAERILMIGGTPIATIKEYFEASTIEEGTGKESPNEMVQAIIDDFKAIVEHSKSGMEIAEEDGDHPSSDLFLDIYTSLEKHIWMLESFLG